MCIHYGLLPYGGLIKVAQLDEVSDRENTVEHAGWNSKEGLPPTSSHSRDRMDGDNRIAAHLERQELRPVYDSHFLFIPVVMTSRKKLSMSQLPWSQLPWPV